MLYKFKLLSNLYLRLYVYLAEWSHYSKMLQYLLFISAYIMLSMHAIKNKHSKSSS